jgi:CheY-like chemotaxis protein
MTQISNTTQAADILVVDDTPANLQLLSPSLSDIFSRSEEVSKIISGRLNGNS